MTSTYLFKSNGLVELARYLSPDTLFAFDLDGTLAPIVERPADAAVAVPVQETLQRLMKLANVSVITGRSRKDALSVLGVEPHLVIGNHGAEWPSGDEPNRNWSQVMTCLKWRESLFDKLSHLPGLEIECKGETIAIHYRHVEAPEQALSLIEAAVKGLEPSPRIIGGKYVVNVLPQDAFTKGEALAAAMAKFGSKRAVYFGDDLTDEEVFKLEGVDVFSIRIGHDDDSAATYHLNEQPEILGLLHSMAGVMEMLWVKEGVWEMP